MTTRDFRNRLGRRLKAAAVSIPSSTELDGLESYYRLLAKWNSKVNLTALNLDAPDDRTFDRLLVEPLSAARQVTDRSAGWVDLGSGGGSPAIPLKLMRPRAHLTMVESKARKAAFLSEAVRVLDLPSTAVANHRFEELDRELSGRCDFVSVRAVRLDSTVFTVARGVLRDGGLLLLFKSAPKPETLQGFELAATTRLTAGENAFLLTYRRVFHVEQN